MPRRLSASLAAQINPALRKRGFAIADVLIRWPMVVGAELAQQTCPERVQFEAGRANAATLKVRVAPGFAVEIQHLAPLLIERINAYYGYGAVARLKFTQGPIAPPSRPAPKPRRALTAAESRRLEEVVAPVADPALKAALQRLGEGLYTGADEKP